MHVTIHLYDIVSELSDAGIITGSVASDIRSANRDVCVSVDAEVDAWDAVEGCSSDALVSILECRGDLPRLDVDVHALADGIVYLRRGDLAMAAVMIERSVSGEVDLSPIERALRS